MTVPVIYQSEYLPYLKKGNGVIQGHLAAKTQLFGLTRFPNAELMLVPATTFTEWYIRDSAYMMNHPHAKDAIHNYPTDLVKYTRVTKTDDDGYFRFSGLPDGKYYVWNVVEREDDEHAIREHTQLAMGPDGQMLSIPVHREGLKVKDDLLVIVGDGQVDQNAKNFGNSIGEFVVVGETTCCSAQL